MGDMGFSGGFETMNDGRDKEGWLHIVSALCYPLQAKTLIGRQLAIGVIFVSSRYPFPRQDTRLTVI
jgi:hypothetical protein